MTCPTRLSDEVELVFDEFGNLGLYHAGTEVEILWLTPAEVEALLETYHERQQHEAEAMYWADDMRDSESA